MKILNAFKESKVLSSSIWVFSSIAITRILHYITGIFAMFILGPEQLGFLALAISAIAIFNNFTIMGFDAKLISIPGNVDHLLNAAWTLELIRGLVVFTLLFLLAPLIANLYDKNNLEVLIQFLALSILFLAFKNIGIVYLRKNLEFRKVFIYEVTQWISYSVVSVFLLYKTNSFWSLAIGHVVASIVLMLMTYIVHPYRPRLSFNFSKFKDIFDFSKWVLINAQMNTFFEHGMTMFIGLFWGTKEVGIYERADFYTRKTGMQSGEVLWKIGLPLLSNNQNQIINLREYFRNMQIIIVLALVPLLSIFAIFLSDFFMLFLDPEWSDISDFIFFMSLLTIVSVASIPPGILFQSIGKPYLETKLIFIKLIIFISCLYPFIIYYDLIGLIYALILGAIIYFIMSYIEVSRILKITLFKSIDLLVLSFAFSFIAGIITNNFFSGETIQSILIGSLVNISVFYVLFLIFSNEIRFFFKTP